MDFPPFRYILDFFFTLCPKRDGKKSQISFGGSLNNFFLLLPSHIILCVFIFRPALWIKTLLIIDIWIKLCCNGLVISRLVQNAALLLFLFHLHCWHNAALLLVRSRNHNCCTTRQQIWSEPCQKVIHQNGGSPSHRCQERIALFVALQATQKRWQGM